MVYYYILPYIKLKDAFLFSRNKKNAFTMRERTETILRNIKFLFFLVYI